MPSLRLDWAKIITDDEGKITAGKLKELFLQEKSQYNSEFNLHHNARKYCNALTNLMDDIIRIIVDIAQKNQQIPHKTYQNLGIFALGGYGRAELCPNSDCDVLIFGAKEAQLAMEIYQQQISYIFGI